MWDLHGSCGAAGSGSWRSIAPVIRRVHMVWLWTDASEQVKRFLPCVSKLGRPSSGQIGTGSQSSSPRMSIECVQLRSTNGVSVQHVPLSPANESGEQQRMLLSWELHHTW